MLFLVLWGFSIRGWSQLVVVGLTDVYIWASLSSCCGFLLSHSDLYSLVRCVLSALCLRKSLSLFLSASIISLVLLLCAPARSCIPLAIFESAWFCDRAFLFLWGATINFLLLLTGISVGALRMTFCSTSSFKLSSSDFWKLFSSSVNWLSKSLSILSFCKLNERSSLPSAKWRLSFFSEKIGFNILYQLGSSSSAKPLPFLHLSEILRHSAFSVVYFLRSFSSEVSNGVYSLKTPFAFVKFSASLTSIKWFSLLLWSNIFWISVKASLFAAFFRESSSRAAAKLCSSSAKTSANNLIYYINIILI